MIEIRDDKCLEIADILLVLCRKIPNLIVWIGPFCKDPEKLIKNIRWVHGDFDLFKINEPTEDDLIRFWEIPEPVKPFRPDTLQRS